MYSRREFLVFDDVLSGLDAATENSVFNNLFAEDGLLRLGRTTIVMATSSSESVHVCQPVWLLTFKQSPA